MAVKKRKLFPIIMVVILVLAGLFVLSVTSSGALEMGVLIKRLQIMGMFLLGLFWNKVLYSVLLLLVLLWAFVTVIHKKRLFQKKYGFWVVFGFIGFLSVVWILLSFSKKIVVFDQFQISLPVGEIYGKKKIGQTFRASYDHLKAVEVLMANYKRNVSGEIYFHLQREGGTSRTLSRKKVNAEKIKDNQYFRYEFPEIEDSKGKKYYFYLNAPQAEPGNALTIWANDREKYLEGTKIVNGEPAYGDLAFKTVYDVGLRNKARLFLDEITEAKPFPLNKNWFYIGLIGLFFLSFALFVTYLIRIVDEQRK